MREVGVFFNAAQDAQAISKIQKSLIQALNEMS
jgi:hypothetical protein